MILKETLEMAEAKLDANAQARLAELVGEAVSSWSEPSAFSPEELQHLKNVADEPFEAADPEAVTSFFGKARG